MGIFTLRRTPAFTDGQEISIRRMSKSLTPKVPAEMDFLNDTTNCHPQPVAKESVLVFARRLSQALTYTLPSHTASTDNGVEGTADEETRGNSARNNYDTVFGLRLEADELAFDEDIIVQDQDVKLEEDHHKRWSELLEEAEHRQYRTDKKPKRRKRKRTVSRVTTLKAGTRSTLQLSPSCANAESRPDVFPPSGGAPPTTSPFPQSSDHYQDDSEDDQIPRRDVVQPISDIPRDDARPRAVPIGDGFDALDVMADYLFRYGCEKKKWFKKPQNSSRNHYPSADSSRIATGVCIRAKTGVQRTYPLNETGLTEFENAMAALNPEVAFKIRSPIVKTVISTCITPDMAEFTINADTRIQILDKLAHLARARKHQYAAFVRDEGVLCVWADAVESIVKTTESLEQSLIDYVWQHENAFKKSGFAAHLEAHAQQDKLLLDRLTSQKAEVLNGDEKSAQAVAMLDPEDSSQTYARQRWKERPVMLYDAFSSGMTVAITLALLALGWRTLVKEYLLDRKATRLLLVATGPLLACVAMFTVQVLVGSFWQILGPIRQVTQNSAYYSAIPPKRTMGELPHVTVWLPVYKESLEEVIIPTVESLKAAQAVYERQGGSVSILVCDDGLQLIHADQAEERKRFYYNHSMAFVARPPHGVDGFERRGRFKKASNMNFAIQLSLRVEEIMDDLRPEAHMALGGASYFWHEQDELDLYETALKLAKDETEGRAWAAGNVRIGSYILIIDSDTRVPEDCFADAVSEFDQHPEVAVIQHSSGVMQVAHHFFENGIAHFTRGIQLAISFCCANGSTAPFVGHNAFLRWSALQEIIFEEDGVRKIWSESHVSEDFALSLALQMKGYILRWATYSDDKFEEGVSLTCDDEVNRWQKYAWGCSELIFHPLRYWPIRGPFTPLFKQYLWSNIPLNCKISVLSYIFSYYAIACAWPLTMLNYIMIGFDLHVDKFYISGWKITFVCICLFSGLGNLASIVLRYRLKVKNTSNFAFNQLAYIPFYSVFFIGLSLQISSALICHLIGYQMTWAATLKTVEVSNFFKEVPAILRKFKFTLPLNIAVAVGIIVTTSSAMPEGWRVVSIEAIVPMALVTAGHILYPIVLNPWLMHFSF